MSIFANLTHCTVYEYFREFNTRVETNGDIAIVTRISDLRLNATNFFTS
jgi:hypothetical protein